MTDPLTLAERNIVEAMDGCSEGETAALIAIEQAFAARLAAGEADTDALRAEITGSARDPHWRAAWEAARSRIAPDTRRWLTTLH